MCTKKIFMQLILDKLLSYLTQDGLCTDPYPSHFTRNYQKSHSKLIKNYENSHLAKMCRKIGQPIALLGFSNSVSDR